MRVCGVSDQLGTGSMCRWPDGNIGVNVINVLPGCTPELYAENIVSVYAHIAQHCNIKAVMTRQARDARVTLDVHGFDGSGGVLADSMLPCGNTPQCRQRYDRSEKWSFTLERPPAGRIWFWMVLLHETLHALGLPHAPSGVKCVIAPMYDPSLDGLQTYDIQELQKRYGKPIAATPVPIPVPGGSTMFGDFFKTLIVGFIKSWLEKAIADGSLIKILEGLLGGLKTGQLNTGDAVMAYVTGDPDVINITQQMTM